MPGVAGCGHDVVLILRSIIFATASARILKCIIYTDASAPPSIEL
jgi:hypothetical protein